VTAHLSDILFSDDIAEMRLLADEHLGRPGPLGDLARYLVYALDENERMLAIMARSRYTRAAARYRKRKRIEMRRRRGMVLHPKRVKVARRPMPMPISDREIEVALKEA
jgi:hypothetical protein